MKKFTQISIPKTTESLQVKEAIGYFTTLLGDGKTVSFKTSAGEEKSLHCSARLDKPRTINNLAGGHPATYTLTLSCSAPIKLRNISQSLAPFEHFLALAQSTTDALAALGIDNEVNLREARHNEFKIHFKSDNAELIETLEQQIAKQSSKTIGQAM